MKFQPTLLTALILISTADAQQFAGDSILSRGEKQYRQTSVPESNEDSC